MMQVFGKSNENELYTLDSSARHSRGFVSLNLGELNCQRSRVCIIVDTTMIEVY